MKANKTVIGELAKCYSLAKVEFGGKKYLACAAEKEDPCFLFDYDGNYVEKLWDGPGGVMTMEQYPDPKKTILLATYRFYSPNNSAESKIVYYIRENDGWHMHVLCNMPFVHRFGILNQNGRHYLIACTLKSAHAYKNDWTCPGRIWVGKFPEDITTIDEQNQLPMHPLVSGLYKNHGFSKVCIDGHDVAVVGSESGIFLVSPPEEDGSEWKYELLLDTKASDMLYEDFDGDGKRELLVISPFHGDTLSVYRKNEKGFENVWTYTEKLPFLHAICSSSIHGKNYGIIGNREDRKMLFAISFNKNTGDYEMEQLDEGAGPANVLYFNNNGKDEIIAANRETNEIAMYELMRD